MMGCQRTLFASTQALGAALGPCHGFPVSFAVIVTELEKATTSRRTRKLLTKHHMIKNFFIITTITEKKRTLQPNYHHICFTFSNECYAVSVCDVCVGV